MAAAKKTTLNSEQTSSLLETLSQRFQEHPDRHGGVSWTDVVTRLEDSPDKCWSLQQMEATGGEPDVIGRDPKTGEILFADCSPESPEGRRSFCYDHVALQTRKKNKPANSATRAAADMGAELLDEAQYHELQQLGAFDTKTSSWLKTPEEVRDLGGAIFGDQRFGRVFIYHNGAESYYAARGFRCLLRV